MNTQARTLALLEAIADRLAPPLPREQLPRSSDTPQRTLQTTEEIARRLGILPPLTAVEEMATVTYSIGTASRDYSTVAAWEADLDNGALYSSGDDAVGEMYNDSIFAESVNINGGGTIGLSSRTLQAAEGERHDGTAGSGVRIIPVSTSAVVVQAANNQDTYVRFVEVDMGGQNIRIAVDDIRGFHQNIVHDSNASRTNAVQGFVRSSGSCQVTNNLIYNLHNTNTGGVNGFFTNVGTAAIDVSNNTFHSLTTTSSGDCYGVNSRDQSNEDIKNNLCTSCDTAGFEISSPANATMDYNATDDTSAAGANSVNSIVAANQYVSTVPGSEDLHLKTGADAIDAGADLGATPAGVSIDIDGRDRDAEGDTWDIGAHEFVGGGAPAPAAAFPFHRYYG